jgi:hypothetical protein
MGGINPADTCGTRLEFDEFLASDFARLDASLIERCLSFTKKAKRQ